jgi:magnesium-transporting ATPase (P-type)
LRFKNAFFQLWPLTLVLALLLGCYTWYSDKNAFVPMYESKAIFTVESTYDTEDIFGTGIFFTALLVAVLLVLQDNGHLSPRDLSWFFTFFVMLQVWNMFNAKAFMTGRSAFAGIWQSKSFLWVIALIIGGQYIIVTFGGKMFNVVPLSPTEWLTISGMTMPVLIFGEIARLFHSRKQVR